VPAVISPAGDVFYAELPLAASPGVHRLTTAAGTQRIAVNLDPAESDLRPIAEAELRERIGEDFEWFSDKLPVRRPQTALLQRELGWNFLYLAGVLAVLEPLLAMWFGHHR
jgi:hypothetical protein